MSIVFVIVKGNTNPSSVNRLNEEIEKFGIGSDFVRKEIINMREFDVVKMLYDKDYFPWEFAPYLKGKAGSGKPSIQRIPMFRQTIVTLKYEDDKLTSWFPTDEETKLIHHRLDVPLDA